jgi:hypothetical protein
VIDDVLCNHEIFGSNRGETHLTQSLDPIVPGSTYEITPSGRMELLECVFEDHSDPNATGWRRLSGMMTPVFTGTRRDMHYHGWLDLFALGRAKFTDGAIVAFEAYTNTWAGPDLGPLQGEQFTSPDSFSPEDEPERHAVGNTSAWMEIMIRRGPPQEPKPIPFMDVVEQANRVLDDATEKEWLDDAERRLRDALSRVDPRPTILGYFAECVDDGLSLYTITLTEVRKHEIGSLSAGEWPCWADIVKAVPEFDNTHVVFDALSRNEWCRRWDMRIQHDRIRAEYGIFG